MMTEDEQNISLISNLQQCHIDMTSLIQLENAEFFARIGGSDTDFIATYLACSKLIGKYGAYEYMKNKIHIIKEFNGYYDTMNNPKNIELFITTMIGAYINCDHFFAVGNALLTQFFPQHINHVFQSDVPALGHALRALCNDIGARQQPLRLYPYPYVECIFNGEFTLFRTFAEVLPNRRVLAVTPFEKSIQYNFANRHKFFPKYAYPEFELVTYNTPITYDGLPRDLYPDQDWFATLDRMKKEICKLTFDVALLSCGSYAMPLGVYIRDTMKRSAIYVGGCLQLYFGITGRRYKNPYFTDQINESVFILPLERHRYILHVKVDEHTPLDSFGAYF